jgi:hypothetical protein
MAHRRNRSCESCECSESIGIGLYICFRFPPTSKEKTKTGGEKHPQVYGKDFCYEWREKEDD